MHPTHVMQCHNVCRDSAQHTKLLKKAALLCIAAQWASPLSQRQATLDDCEGLEYVFCPFNVAAKAPIAICACSNELRQSRLHICILIDAQLFNVRVARQEEPVQNSARDVSVL